MTGFDTPLPVCYAREIRALEQAAARVGGEPLLQRAGRAAAELTRARLLPEGKSSVLVVAGPGNNGGDAMVAARHLKDWWHAVTVVFTGRREKLSTDARQALDEWCAAGGTLLPEIPAQGRWDAVIDGLFGIGLERDLDPRYAALVERINGLGLPVLSIDIPSGLDGDSGRVCGRAVRATLTLTFIALKPGLLTGAGPACCGEIVLDELGVNPIRSSISVLDRRSAVAALAPRAADSHKGSFGSVGILGGSRGMAGAALLAGRAAYRLGAGRVYLGLLAPGAPACDPGQPELMLRRADELFQLEQLTCLAAGPGLGLAPEAEFLLGCALDAALPLVLDADALNLIALRAALGERLATRRAPTLLTPHPAEAARLLGQDTRAVQDDRPAAARALAQRYGAQVVLKGAGSVLARPDGFMEINTTGNPGLASAGMGDVLTGMVAAFLAQGLAPEAALRLAVFLHGAAADDCVQDGIGPVGLSCGEVTDAARRLLNLWLYGEAVKGEG